MEFLKNKILFNVLGFAIICSCARPIPIILDDDPYSCSWNQSGGGPGRNAFISAASNDTIQFRWKRLNRASLVLEPTFALGVLILPGADRHLYIASLKSGAVIGNIEFSDPISSPCLISDSLVVVNENGKRLNILNWVTGRRVWSVELKSSEIEPLASNGRLYWQDGSRVLHCYDLAEGRRIWETELDTRIAAAPAADSSSLIVVGTSGIVECLSLIDGSSRWLVNTKLRFRNPAAIIDGFAIMASADGRLLKLNMSDGSIAWGNEIGSIVLTPLATDGTGIFLGTPDGRLVKFNFETGRLEWESKTDGPIKGGASIIGNIVVFVSLNHHAYFVDKNNGIILCDYQAGGMLSTRPVVCANRIYIAGEDKNLYCFQVTQHGQ